MLRISKILYEYRRLNVKDDMNILKSLTYSYNCILDRVYIVGSFVKGENREYNSRMTTEVFGYFSCCFLFI